MSFNRESALNQAKKDLAEKLGVAESNIESSVTDAEFPNASLGAAVRGEMSMMMISEGWRIELQVEGRKYEYRADKNQLRLFDFKGKNYIIKS